MSTAVAVPGQLAGSSWAREMADKVGKQNLALASMRGERDELLGKLKDQTAIAKRAEKDAASKYGFGGTVVVAGAGAYIGGIVDEWFGSGPDDIVSASDVFAVACAGAGYAMKSETLKTLALGPLMRSSYQAGRKSVPFLAEKVMKLWTGGK